MKVDGEMIHSPIKGEVKALSEVNDSVFSAEIMEKGLRLPEEGLAAAPVSGIITNTDQYAVTAVKESGTVKTNEALLALS